MIKGIRVMPDDSKLYIPDDIPEFVAKYQKRTAKKPRVRRDDLVKGMIVVVLEGVFASKRVVYLGKLDNNLALCVGPKSVNEVPLFKIDERYLLATSAVLKLDVSTDGVDEDKIILSERDVYNVPMDVELTDAEKEIDAVAARAVKGTKFMRTYLSEPFEVDNSREFYSLRY